MITTAFGGSRGDRSGRFHYLLAANQVLILANQGARLNGNTGVLAPKRKTCRKAVEALVPAIIFPHDADNSLVWDHRHRTSPQPGCTPTQNRFASSPQKLAAPSASSCLVLRSSLANRLSNMEGHCD